LGDKDLLRKRNRGSGGYGNTVKGIKFADRNHYDKPIA